MRAPINEATGTSGETEVHGEFERLGWAAVHDSRHDTGTDLFLRPRDARRFELGVVMGAQVKTGPSFFRTPRTDDAGSIDGWWYAESDRKHFDLWLNHALPHVVILRDQKTDTSYWAHVRDDAVIPTGKGAKIFVPIVNTIDVEHNDELLKIAMTQGSSMGLEGSAWNQASVLPRDRLRYALIAPRVISPHPNRGAVDVDGAEGLAGQVLCRRELNFQLGRETSAVPPEERSMGWYGPNLDEASRSTQWAWRATAALHNWIVSFDLESVAALFEVATTDEETAAAAAMLAGVHLEGGAPDRALEVLDVALGADTAWPADHAWLQALRAWSLLEIGKREQAIDAAFTVLKTRQGMPTDLTVAALAGSATNVLFSASGWHGSPSNRSPSEDQPKATLGELIGNSDTAVSWWRSQLLAWALPHEIDGVFKKWANDKSISFAGADSVHTHLRSASLISIFSADGPAWGDAIALLAKHLLAAGAEDETATLLAALRHGATPHEVELAVSNVVREGPATAARDAAARIDPARSTSSTAAADLAVIRAAGPVLDPQQADDLCHWIIEELSDPSDYRTRVGETFWVEHELTNTLRQVVGAASDEGARRVVDFLVSADHDQNLLVQQELARAIRNVPLDAWTPDDLMRAAQAYEESTGEMRSAFQRVLWKHNEKVRADVIEEASSGATGALNGVSDVEDLPRGACIALISALADETTKLCEGLATGQPLGSRSVSSLVLMNLWHPDHAQWDPVIQALREERLFAVNIEAALRLIADRSDRIPVGVSDSLIEAVRPVLYRDPDRFGDARGAAFEAGPRQSHDCRSAWMGRSMSLA
ncbi:hypothetical protein GCM10027063_40870 [Promicromonospora xylanilytica]